MWIVEVRKSGYEFELYRFNPLKDKKCVWH